MFTTIYRKCYLLISFAFLCLMSCNANANLFSLTEEQINTYLNDKLVIEDKLNLPGLFSVDYKLDQLSTKIGRTSDKKVEINGRIDGIFQLSKKNFATKINLTIDTIPYYDPETGSVYLRDVRVLNWSSDSNDYTETLKLIMPVINNSIALILNNTPIYTLDDNKPRDVIIKKFAKGIKVEEGRLALDTNVI